MQAFAGQSSTAPENARLFNEIAQKGRELEISSQHKSQFVAATARTASTEPKDGRRAVRSPPAPRCRSPIQPNRAHPQTQSITRTGLLSSMKSSRHSGNSVVCPRSAPATKRFIDPPGESQEKHSSGRVFTRPGSRTDDG